MPGREASPQHGQGRGFVRRPLATLASGPSVTCFAKEVFDAGTAGLQLDRGVGATFSGQLELFVYPLVFPRVGLPNPGHTTHTNP